jgi:predicted AlkP superfamily phosphohydrolase/phosphomutase
VQAAFRTVDRKMETAHYLFAKERWDCFMVTIGETDALAHLLWHCHDPGSPLAGEGAIPCSGTDPLQRLYERIDGHIGRLLAAAGPDTDVIVLSDHGHAGNGDRAIHLNRWLAQQGLLRYRRRGVVGRSTRWLMDLAKKVAATNIVPRPVRKALFRRTGMAGAIESYVRFARIDWPRTRAYSEETPYFPMIWLNVAGREPLGAVAAGEEREELCQDLIRRLTAWTDPRTGRPVVRRVHRREELYQGPFVERSPDLVIEWNLDGRYSYLFKSSSPDDADAPTIAPIDRKARATTKSGDHRDDGILVASGPSIKPGRIEGARLLDLAPTLLHLLGLEVPEDMDGRVLEPLLDDGFRSRNPIRFRAGSQVDGPTGGADYSDEDEEAIRRRLEGLGYLE